MSDDTTPAIGYDELLAAHRDAIDARDRARRVAVHLEQELAHTATEARLGIARLCEALSRVSTDHGVPVPEHVAAFVAGIEAHQTFREDL